MSSFLYDLFDAAEFWALLFPLLFIFPLRKNETWKRPLVLFIILALPINLISCLIANSKSIPFKLPLAHNTVLYNIMSVIRFSCFSWFFFMIAQKGFSTIRKMIPVAYIISFTIIFTWVDSFLNPERISSNLLAAEALLLLIYCLLAYFSIYNADETEPQSDSQLWIISGLAMYVVIDFFIYLFYKPLLLEDPVLADKVWTIHNIAFTLFCIAMARGFYLNNQSARQKTPAKIS